MLISLVKLTIFKWDMCYFQCTIAAVRCFIGKLIIVSSSNRFFKSSIVFKKFFFSFFFFEQQLTSITHAASCYFVINNCGVYEKRNTIVLFFLLFRFFWRNYVQILVIIYIVVIFELLEYADSSKLWWILKFREILFWNNVNFARSIDTSGRRTVTILLPANCCLF